MCVRVFYNGKVIITTMNRNSRMNGAVNQPYIAFDPEEAEFLCDYDVKLESKKIILSNIHNIVLRFHLPKKRILTFIALITSWVLLTVLYLNYNPTDKLFFNLLLVMLLGAIIIVFWILQHYIAVSFEIRRLKKLYNSLKWPVTSYFAFFEEGILVKSYDIEGIFYWDDFKNIIASSNVITFQFYPKGTPKGDLLKNHYPKLRPFYLIIDDDKKIQSILAKVNHQHDDLVEFK